MRLLGLLGLITLIHCELVSAATELKVMSFNLRVPVDPAPNDWASRSPRVMNIILKNKPDVLGVQEAIPLQISDLSEHLKNYAQVGRGRELNGNGEATQIFFNKDRWRLDKTDFGTLQISPTPDVVGSNGWNFQFSRIYTWMHLNSKKTGKGVYIFNTHFPLKPEERNIAVKQLASSISERKNKKDPVVLLGDFNACEVEASMKYLRGDSGSPITMTDSFLLKHPDDKVWTYHDFGKKQEGCRIDYIYVAGALRVLSSDVIKDAEAAGFASDHYAVSARIRLN